MKNVGYGISLIRIPALSLTGYVTNLGQVMSSFCLLICKIEIFSDSMILQIKGASIKLILQVNSLFLWNQKPGIVSTPLVQINLSLYFVIF